MKSILTTSVLFFSSARRRRADEKKIGLGHLGRFSMVLM